MISRRDGGPSLYVLAGSGPRLSGMIRESGSQHFRVKAHGIDSTRNPTFGDVTGTEAIKAVRQPPSVFQSVLKLFARDEFNTSIERHDARDCVVGFSFKSHLLAMLCARFAGSAGLRGIESSLASHANRLHAMHATPPGYAAS
jgi:hypothetical protein